MNTLIDPLAKVMLRGSLELFGRLCSARLSVLIFHHVHAMPDQLFRHEPDATRFEALMRFVAATYRVMTLGEAIDHIAIDTLPPRSLVITFDDGYADNAEVAMPILQRLGLRATFFISSGFLDGGLMWNDSVVACLRATSLESVNLAGYGLGQQSLRTMEDRRRCINELLPRIRYLPLLDRADALLRLQRLCRVRDLPRHQMMSSEQVRAMHRAGMEIGAHTVSHPILTSLSANDAESEIREGRKALESILDAPVDVFAYPNGKPRQDYDSSHAAIVRKLGFRGAVSTAPGAAQVGDDLFQIPRFTPWGRTTWLWGGRLALNQTNVRFDVAS